MSQIKIPRTPISPIPALKNAGGHVGRVWSDVRSFDLKWILPYETVFSTRILRNPSTWIMLLFGFAPLLGALTLHTLEPLLVCLLVYFATAWAAYSYVFIAKRTVDLRFGLLTALCAILISVPIVLLTKTLLPFSFLYRLAASSPYLIQRLIGFVVGVGINEELFKALPIMLLAFKWNKLQKPLDGIFLGAMAGLGLSIPEGFRYISHTPDLLSGLGQTLLRTTTLPFLHATWTAITGYFIALAVVTPRRRSALCLLGLCISATLHGCYDLFATVGSVTSLAFAGLAYLLLISYVERSQDMVRELQRGEAVTGTATSL